jgi:hypothetical protein
VEVAMNHQFRRVAAALVLVVAVTGCGSGSDEVPDGTDGTSAAFDLTTSPEFVNRLIPGTRPFALVTVDSDVDGVVQLSGRSEFAGLDVTLRPGEIGPGEVAEIWVEIPPVGNDTEFTVSVTGVRGAVERTVEVTATAVPGNDDLEPTAREIAEVFLRELGDDVDALPADVTELTNGTPIAGLLVVTHYAWFLDDVELDLAWHIMVAPDDFAELSLRPRDELQPTSAYRLDSWSTALSGGSFEIVEIPAPPEVTR